MDKIKIAGPIQDDAAGGYVGSVYVIESDSIDSAYKILETDPYYQADIWSEIEHHEYKGYAGTWVGGKNWPGSAKE